MAFQSYTSATNVVRCEFFASPTSAETYAYALSAGVLYEAYGNSRPPDGTYWTDSSLYGRGINLDFAGGELAAAGAPFTYPYGGQIFMVSGDTTPVYIGIIESNGLYVPEQSWAVLPDGRLAHRGQSNPYYQTTDTSANKAFVLPAGQSLSALEFDFGNKSSYVNLYLCVEDSDASLLASTIDHETRTGVNDILLYSVSASNATVSVPLTGFSNAVAGQEIIIKSVWNYTTSASSPDVSLEDMLHKSTWYTGYKNRTKWYHVGNWNPSGLNWLGFETLETTSATAQLDTSASGISHFLIKDDGSWRFENWTAGEYDDFYGALSTPQLDVVDSEEEITCDNAPTISLSLLPNVAQEEEVVTAQTTITNSESATSYDWSWGDGHSTLSGGASEQHSWSGISETTTYTVGVTANGAICGTGMALATIDIWPALTTTTATECTTSAEYIELCGKAVTRFGECRQIDLTSFLPDYAREYDTLQFTQFFENFLNTLYAGACGSTISTSAYIETSGETSGASATDINVEEYTYNEPTISTTTDECHECSAFDQTQTISILEKIFRLTETHDPELIDLEFIQFFASNLGYDVSVNRQEMGNLGESTSGVCSVNNAEKYLRFMIQNLPNWYKIKTTQNAIKVMLFSFGLVGDILNYYTRDYNADWRLSQPEYYTSGTGDSVIRENFDKIPDSWYPTSHFSVWFDVRRSATNFSFNIEKQNAIIRAIDSVRPINTVFEGVQAYLDGLVCSYARAITRIRKYIRVPSGDRYADWYGWVDTH